jgi:5-methylcytosine-specific restriction protein A
MPNRPQSKRLPWITALPKKDANKGEDSKFYNSPTWRKLRKMFITQYPVCAVCGTPASVVDHITPIKHGGDRYSFSNMQAMCAKCHNAKRGREAHIKPSR